MTHGVIFFDLEYTAWEGSQARRWSEPWEHREIIQIAALRVTADDGLVERAAFDRLVRPKYNPVLSDYIMRLTGIQQAEVDARGMGFIKAFADFHAFCEQGCLPLYCWANDAAVLTENCALHDTDPAPFPAGIFDIRPVFEKAGIDTRQYTSGTVHQAVGADFAWAAHNALNDVRSMAITLRHLIRSGRTGVDWMEQAARYDWFC